MDAHIRWLRRRVITGVGGRILFEFLLVSAATVVTLAAAGGGAAGRDRLAPTATAALAAGLTVVGLRLAWALATNPINNRYLLAWTDPSLELQPVPLLDPLDAVPSETGLIFAVRFADPATGRSIGVHRNDSGSTILTAVDGDREHTAISRLSDGRMLVTSANLIPPCGSVIINRCPAAGPSELLQSHSARLDELAGRGLEAIRTDNLAVTEQLHLEWRSWDELGPFVGPFVAVDHHRRPLAIQVGVDRDSLWTRTVGARSTNTVIADNKVVPESAPHTARIPTPGLITNRFGLIMAPAPSISASISDRDHAAPAAEAPQPAPSQDRPTAPPPSSPVRPGGSARTS